MSWIKFETATSDKPEVWEIATRLKIDPDAVVGKLLRVWAWFDKHTEFGNAPSVTKTLLDRNVGVTGFCEAMIFVGWMVETEGAVSLPNFDRHNGKTAKSRVLTAKRVGKLRKCNGDVTLENKKCNAAIVTQALPKEEKRRKEIPPMSPKGELEWIPDQVELPKNIDSPEMREAWLAWCRHRREIKKPLKSTMVERQLREFAAWGVARSVAAIDYTITKGWQGIQEPKVDSSASKHVESKPSVDDDYKKRRVEEARKLRAASGGLFGNE